MTMHIRLKTLLLLVSPLLLLVATAYVQWGTVGIPALPPNRVFTPETAVEPYGFPAWLRITHYVNFLFLILLVRSGLQILADHPRLYWNVHCTPGTEWLRLTPVEVPKDRVWTAKDDSRYLSPWIGLPGYRHTVGMARHWHFLSVLFWVGNGLVFVVLLFSMGQWQRLVPMSWQIVPDAWAVFVHYATFHLPPEPNGFYSYNALQQLAYFGVVFVLAPLAILTGPSMSPAFTARFTWYPKLPGNRQIGRSLHFLIMCSFLPFVFMHVTMVVLTGFVQNINHIVVGTDDANPAGLYLGLLGVGLVVLLNVFANWAAWEAPPSRPARRQGDRQPGDGALARPPRPGGSVPPRRGIALLLGQRQDAGLRRVENASRRQFQKLPAQGIRSGGESGRAITGRPPGVGSENSDHAAPLYPRLVRHCRVGWTAAGGTCETGPSETQCEGHHLLLVQRGRRVQHWHRGWSILRQPLARERAKPPNIAGVRDELPAAQSSARSPVAAACREPARLQDGQVDPGDRVCRKRRVDLQGRRRLRRGQGVLRRTSQHMTSGESLVPA